MIDTQLIAQIQRYANKQIRYGTKKDLIIARAVSEFEDSLPDQVSTITRTFLDGNPDYDTVQKLMRSQVLVNVTNNKRCFLYDPVDRTRTKFDTASFKHKVDYKHVQEQIHQNTILCNFDYDPFTPQIVYPGKDGFMVYNEFEPASWQKEWFYSNGTIEISSYPTVPAPIDKFLRHLVNDDSKSYNYILDWLAFGIRNKNFCFLVTIGRQGIGKGKLGDIMRCIFGETNYYVGGDKMFSGQFNSQIANRRLVYCDEALLKQKAAQNRLKEAANLIVEKEAKGVDAENVRNFANFYISSNDLDGLPMTEDDRRFSVIELTDTKLPEVMTYEEIDSLDKDQEMLDNFARFLYHREVEAKNMLYPLKTVKRERIIEFTKAEWEKIFLYKLCNQYQGKFIELKQVKSDIREEGSSYSPGQPALEKLAIKEPGVFEVRRAREDEKDEHGSRPYGVYVYK